MGQEGGSNSRQEVPGTPGLGLQADGQGGTAPRASAFMAFPAWPRTSPRGGRMEVKPRASFTHPQDANLSHALSLRGNQRMLPKTYIAFDSIFKLGFPAAAAACTHSTDDGIRGCGKQGQEEEAAFNWQIIAEGPRSRLPESPRATSLRLTQSAPLRAQCSNHPGHSSHLGLSSERRFQSDNMKNKRDSLFHWHQQKKEEEAN